MQALRLFAALPAAQKRVQHFADDGAGPDDGHLHHDVVETLGPQARQARHLRAAFHLKQSDGVGFLQRLINHAGRLAADARGPLLRDTQSRMSWMESSSTAIMPRPSRSTLMMPMSAQSSLSHWMTTRPGMVAGSSGTTESSWPSQITMPPECWPRWRGRS